MSAIEDDPRVRRMGDALAARGWNVVGFGLEGGKSPPPAWRIWRVKPFEAPDAGAAARPRGLLEKVVHYGRLWWGARRSGEGARRQFYAQNRSAGDIQAAVLEKGERALWIANDWNMLPIAAEAVERFGGALVYDSHEFAVHEFEEHWDWRVFRQPLVRTIEREHIGLAAIVTSVSPAITQALVRRYRLTSPAMTLRNMPGYVETAFRATAEPTRLLYQGVVSAGRGLEALIDAVDLVERPIELVIRGPGRADYVAGLRSRAAAIGAPERITFADPVPASELIAAARDCDLGVMLLPGHSAHNQAALPNKLFEYMMAGLGLVVTDLSAMGALIEETGAGLCVSGLEAASIARAIDCVSVEAVDLMKKNALEAAKRLHFGAEVEPVIRAYEAAHDESSGATPPM